MALGYISAFSETLSLGVIVEKGKLLLSNDNNNNNNNKSNSNNKKIIKIIKIIGINYYVMDFIGIAFFKKN